MYALIAVTLFVAVLVLYVVLTLIAQNRADRRERLRATAQKLWLNPADIPESVRRSLLEKAH